MHLSKKENDKETQQQTLSKVNAFHLMMNGNHQSGKNGRKRRRKHRTIIDQESDIKSEHVEVENKPKKRGRPRLSSQKLQQNLDNNELQKQPQQQNDISNTMVNIIDKSEEDQKQPYMNLRPRKKQITICSEREEKENVIFLDDSLSSSSSSSSCSPSPKKQRCPRPQMPIPAIDMSILEARQQFLQSSLPENVRRIMEKSKPHNTADGLSEIYETLPFPAISHVQQKTDSIYWHLDELTTSELNQSPPSPLSQIRRFKYDWPDDNFRLLPQIHAGTKCGSYKVIKVADCHKYLDDNGKKEAMKNHLKCLLARKEKNNQEQNDDSVYSMWTDKYSPQVADEVLGNEDAIDYLKCWLKNFTGDGDKNQCSSSDNEEDSDFEEFGGGRSGGKSVTRNATLIVHGPHGSGKSSSIYAICKEFEIKIIELNASSRRTGKILMQEFQEATRSHQMSLSCLLLIEDVDLVFDHQDEGFLTALQHLTNTTKRPIVLTTNDVKSPLVQQKFANQYKCIKFKRVERTVLVPWLQALCLVEGYYVQSKNLHQLYRDCNGDIRKCILQLQFLLDSGGELDEVNELLPITEACEQIFSNVEKVKPNGKFKIDYLENDLNFHNGDADDKGLTFSSHSFDHISTIYHAISKINDLKHSFSNEFAIINNNNFLSDLIRQTAKSNRIIFNTYLERGIWESSLWRLLTNVELHVDYLPIMRQIFKTEEHRETNNPKRGGRRFRHIFQDWGILCERKDYGKICKLHSFKLN